MNRNVTKIIRNLSLSVFLITIAISVWLLLYFLTPAINSYLLSVEQDERFQIEMINKTKEIQSIIYESSLAAIVIYLSDEKIIQPSDSERLVKESIDKLSTYSEQLGKLVKYISDYQLKQKKKNDSIFTKPNKAPVSDKGFAKLNFTEVKGYFVQSDLEGQLFIIEGLVINNYSENKSNILLKGSIYDKVDKLIRQTEVYAGNTFSDNELKTQSLTKMKEALKLPTGKGNSNVNVVPGKSVPFMIIFENLPDNLEEFVVEAVSSSPGKVSY